ncbi:pro-neuregulin- membrane-bound isoform- hypothetical protein [Limosa lapponica baueri]|uniref:Ig-like domain-containing protein n=1 Tax=Limosa lapponica baueri TaxID=1758121 RepID=A0A2I0UNH1_LIMLA|nr:pro-neuregulin- membrane-bound isoform- hypothetical protein [Limosa lapponica baueri]
MNYVLGNEAHFFSIKFSLTKGAFRSEKHPTLSLNKSCHNLYSKMFVGLHDWARAIFLFAKDCAIKVVKWLRTRRATSEGSIQYSLAPTQTDVNNSSNTVPPKLKEMKNQEAAVGQKLVLRCETTSEYPALRFKWLKNGKEITKKNRPENIKIPKKQKKYSELHIYRATLADAGEYACRVSSKLGNDSTKASVIITDTNDGLSCGSVLAFLGGVK